MLNNYSEKSLLMEYIKPETEVLELEWNVMKDSISLPQSGEGNGDSKTDDNWGKETRDIWEDELFPSDEGSKQQASPFEE